MVASSLIEGSVHLLLKVDGMVTSLIKKGDGDLFLHLKQGHHLPKVKDMVNSSSH